MPKIASGQAYLQSWALSCVPMKVSLSSPVTPSLLPHSRCCGWCGRRRCAPLLLMRLGRPAASAAGCAACCTACWAACHAWRSPLWSPRAWQHASDCPSAMTRWLLVLKPVSSMLCVCHSGPLLFLLGPRCCSRDRLTCLAFPLAFATSHACFALLRPQFSLRPRSCFLIDFINAAAPCLCVQCLSPPFAHSDQGPSCT